MEKHLDLNILLLPIPFNGTNSVEASPRTNAMNGYCEGDKCDRNGCEGVIQLHPIENCSCHIFAPCFACTSPRCFCDVCGWEESEDEIEKDDQLNAIELASYIFHEHSLDKTKIDWKSKSHTHFSMIKKGCFPKGTSREEVRKQVDGTFGGRFTHWDEKSCEFEFIAYTD